MDKTIGVCGFISTGSSAVSDFLKEFDENIVLDDFEFVLSYIPDGIEDLAYHLHEGFSKHWSSIVALKRFKRLYNSKYMQSFEIATHGKFKTLSDIYIKNIIQVEWRGISYIDFIAYPFSRMFKVQRIFFSQLKKIIAKFENIFNIEINTIAVNKYSFSAFPEDFYDITKKYIHDILVAMGKESGKNIVLDQPFVANNPQKSYKYFDNPKAIIIDRDPRDHYLFNKIFLRSKGIRIIPTDTVMNYILFYRNMRKNMPQISQDVLHIQFEDMIYEYDKTSQKIIEFLNLKEHSRSKSIFNPTLSMVNTQLFDIYPEYEKDIRCIEKELPEYLYSFENYKGIKTSQGVMFFGKSPLNRKGL
jgi:hypothetical protein